ncbi:MAG TPA: NAD-dependent epimerase/dehydratase family protein [Anaerolineales bacterium]|nr:NAD-dependent epimerase/dehydratase family protein [Anaerolineales bacterium]
MTERVLVTGATGFIGHHLVQHLIQRGDQVTCLVRPSSDTSSLDRANLQFAVGDMGDPPSLRAAIAGAEVVYHLAAALTARRPQDLMRVNTAGLTALAEACTQQPNPPVLVVLSSLAAAGPSPAGRPRTEGDPAGPVSHYGRSKLAGEQAARAHASQVPVTIVRASWVFGEWDRDTLAIFRTVRYGLHLVPVARSNRYSLIHAADLAGFLALAALRGERCGPDRPAGDGLYYAAAEPALDYPEIGQMAAAAMERRRPRVLHLPRPLTLAMAAIPQLVTAALGRPPSIVNLDKAREGFAGSWVCSAEKAQRQLGFTASAPLADRMRQTASWYQERGWL